MWVNAFGVVEMNIVGHVMLSELIEFPAGGIFISESNILHVRSPDWILASNFYYMHVRNMAGCKKVSRCGTRGESEESIACRRGSAQVRDPPWLRNPGQMSQEVERRDISGPTKWLVSSKIKIQTFCMLQKMRTCTTHSFNFDSSLIPHPVIRLLDKKRKHWRIQRTG